MADEKISLLPSAGTLDGTEPVPVVKAGVTSQTTTQAIADLAAGQLTADQVDAIDNANAPDAGNPFATMADILAGVVYQGVWNATTNTPTLTSSVGTQGYYYVVSVAGTTNLNGITDWEIGDWAIFNGAVWQKVDNTDAVISVNGQTGIVSLTTSDISEGSNQYFTTARVLATAITGFVAGAGTVAATDTILQALNKIVGNVDANRTFVESISLQDNGTSIAATTYTIELYANYAYTINELKIIADAGTCTANLKINSTSVTSISAVAVSTSIATATASGANTVSVGDKITLVTTSNSGLNNLQLTIKTTRI